MIPVDFPEANTKFGPPCDLEESQCHTVAGHVHQVVGGSCDGVPQVIIAWKPDERELEIIKNGGVIYLSCLGSLPPHYLSTSFEEATHPA